MFYCKLVILSVLCGFFCFLGNSNAEVSERTGSYTNAVVLLDNGIIFEAIHELELYLKENPKDEDAYMLLARTLQRVKRDRQAAVAAAHVLRINPDNAEAQRLLTSVRIKLGRDLDRSDPAALLDYARLCSRPETYDRAAYFYNLYLEQDDDPLVHMEFAKVLYWAENYAAAKRHLLIYLDAKPDDYDMRGLLGKIYSAMGDFDGAVEQYRLCVKGKPDNVEMKLNLARALMWNSQEDEAEKLLNDIRKRSNEYDAPLLLLASIARMQGRVVDEYNLYKSVLKTNPDNKTALDRVKELETGNVLAIAKLLNILNKNHKNIDVRKKLVELYLSENRYGEAIPHLEVLNRLVPMDVEIANKLQDCREKERELAMSAVKSFGKYQEKANLKLIERSKNWLRLNPNDYRTRFQLADILLKSDRYDSAIAQLEILESMTPSDKRISEKLQLARSLSHASTVSTNSESKEE